MMIVRKKGPASKPRRSRRWRDEMRKKAEREQQERRQRRLGDGDKPRIAIEGDSAHDRYLERQVAFARRFGVAGRLLHAGAWMLHNCVAHPLLGLLPGRWTLRLHDRTADWLNLSPAPTRAPAPQIGDRRAWVLHNCVAHPLMGLAPLGISFDLHDTTADDMDVPGWV